MKLVRLEQQFLERKGDIVFRGKKCSNRENGLFWGSVIGRIQYDNLEDRVVLLGCDIR